MTCAQTALAAAQRNKTIGQLIDESLDFYGIKSREQALDLVRRARARSALSEAQSLTLAQEEEEEEEEEEEVQAVRHAS